MIAMIVVVNHVQIIDTRRNRIMKRSKLYWLPVAATLLIASGCDETGNTNPDSNCSADADTWKCDGNTLLKCISGNWENIQSCEGNTQCNAEAGTCAPNETSGCTDGTWNCDGNTLSKCTDGKWGNHQTCEGNTKCNAETGACEPSSENGCTDTEHFFAGKCEADDITHCGTHTNDCTKTPGWKSGDCIGKKCFAEECETGYHLASLFDDDNEERTICEEDTHDACGSINKKCGAEEICTQGECKDSCQPGEVICNGSCINPNTSTKFCGADTSCQSYIACAESENCVGGKCVLSSCQNADETICTENQQSICVNIHGNNPNHCGACGAACTDKETAKASGCNSGQCTYTCKDSMVNCGSETAPMCLSEDQLKSDASHCGKCDTKCASNEFCQNGQCITNSCDSNQCLFNNACVNQNDHCGTQCVNCNTANNASSGVCQNGSCTISACVVGYHLYNNTCEEDNTTNCGAHGTQCNEPNATNNCTNGLCQVIACNTGYHLYNNTCEEDSTTNCGTHGTECNVANATNTCTNGKCQVVGCDSGYEDFHTFEGEEKEIWENLSANEYHTDCIGVMTLKWSVDNSNKPISLPIQERPRSITIDWGDGHIQGVKPSLDQGDEGYIQHTYTKKGTYTIKVKGTINNWRCSSDEYNCSSPCTGSKDCSSLCSNGLVEIQSYGDTSFGNYAFCGANKLEKIPESMPRFHCDLFSCNKMIGTFYGATTFNQPLDNWDTSKVKDMSYMFYYARFFNGSLNDWDTSNVTNMEKLFYGATSFNQPLNNWDTSKVTNMGYMFYGATSFNQPLNDWDTSNVMSMDGMFRGATSFNQPLNNWDVSNITHMSSMFSGSNLSNDNYCKLFTGAYSAIWTKFKSYLGISYTCP